MKRAIYIFEEIKVNFDVRYAIIKQIDINIIYEKCYTIKRDMEYLRDEEDKSVCKYSRLKEYYYSWKI